MATKKEVKQEAVVDKFRVSVLTPEGWVVVYEGDQETAGPALTTFVREGVAAVNDETGATQVFKVIRGKIEKI